MSLQGQHLGQYRLLHLLGSGGMGEVYLAEDARIGRQVAIKVIRGDDIAYPGSESATEAARLFEREAKAIARLDHPNILPLYAYGEETLQAMSLTYLVMPYRKEGTLAHWLRQRGSSALLTPAEIVPLVQQAAAALQHAHNQHIIHQDIKPSNFLVRLRDEQPDRPDLLLADFGIAKLASAAASTSHSIRGTPTYMAPEQWEGLPVAATDQYALAIMIYELLIGRPPFQGTPSQVMHQHYSSPPPAPSSLNERLSLVIDAVLLRALAKQSNERFSSVAAFAQAFQQAMHSSGDLRATLAISRAEAESGTTRNLTLPGGRRLSVTVPAGVCDGSILRLEGQGLPSVAGGPLGSLVLTMRISEESPPSLSPASTAPTRAISMPTGLAFSAHNRRWPGADSDAAAPLKQRLPLSTSNANGGTPIILVAQASPEIIEYPIPTPQSRPREITAGTDGNLWFTEYTGNKIGRITTNGRITEYPLPTSYGRPYGITTGSNGNLWFTEENGNKIGRITPDGKITEYPLPTPQNHPYGIAARYIGNLWFTECDGNKIGRITTGSRISEYSIPTSKSGTVGIAVGPDGNLWFTECDGNKIGRITTSGKITEYPLPTPKSRPRGITAGPDGNLWFTETGGNKIGRITTEGRITEYPLPTPYSRPYGIITGPDGNLWFTEDGGNKIGRITTNGEITEYPLPTPQSRPRGIAAGPDGNLWFTEYMGNKIGRLTTGK